MKDTIPAIVFPLPVERALFKDMPDVNGRILLEIVLEVKYDGLVKTQKASFPVIPAEAGIQEYQEILDPGACPPQVGSPR